MSIAEEWLEKDSHGYFFLRDDRGNEIQCTEHFSFKGNDGNERVKYFEFVFDIPKSEIGKYSLYGTFVTGGVFTRGNWKVTFRLEQANKN